MLLDDYLREAWSPGDVIQLRPGAYTTRGSQAPGAVIPPGVTLDARGSTIAIADPVIGEQPWIEPPLMAEDSRIVGGEWDLGNHGGIAQSGFRALGTAYIEGATLRGLFGRRRAAGGHPLKEVFAFCQPDGGIGGTTILGLIATCLVDDPDNYASGIYTNDRGSKVENCEMQLGRCGQFAYSCSQRCEFVSCSGEAARFGYTDTGSFLGVFKNCTGRAHWAAWAFAGSGGVLAPPRSLLASECEIDASGGRVVEFDDTHGEQECTVVIMGGKYVGDYRLASTSKRSRMLAFGSEISAVQDHRPNGEPEPIIA